MLRGRCPKKSKSVWDAELEWIIQHRSSTISSPESVRWPPISELDSSQAHGNCTHYD
jgi:hypothetical protein